MILCSSEIKNIKFMKIYMTMHLVVKQAEREREKNMTSM